jgi:hypothetical protein
MTTRLTPSEIIAAVAALNGWTVRALRNASPHYYALAARVLACAPSDVTDIERAAARRGALGHLRPPRAPRGRPA